MKRPRKIQIMPALNGYFVQVDCQTVVFESREHLIKALDMYLADPTAEENEWRKNALHPIAEEMIRPEELTVPSLGRRLIDPATGAQCEARAQIAATDPSSIPCNPVNR